MTSSLLPKDSPVHDGAQRSHSHEALKRRARAAVPQFLQRLVRTVRETRRLGSVHRRACDASRLVSHDRISRTGLFESRIIDVEWCEIRERIEQFAIPDESQGVNSGDRRALYYLIRQLEARAVLEIGTHIGASTVHIAAALSQNRRELRGTARLVTVDVADVNDSAAKRWLRFGVKNSPLQMINNMCCGDFVEFETRRSLDYLDECRDRFDLMFLDGDHSAATVYQEIPAALPCLSSDGIILLHDYYPALRPLWRRRPVAPGPFLAVERLRAEGVPVKPLPLSPLPWTTKLESRNTSLALLLRNA